MLKEKARAKVNLTLHIEGRREDGYHDLTSLTVFAGIGDVVTLDASKTLNLTLSGPFASAAGEIENNLVLCAARHLARHVRNLQTGHFHLVKNLPAAAGLGGGSADAAAALRLLARLNTISLDDQRLMETARSLGADVPVCMEQKPRLMHGIGHDLTFPLNWPRLFAVLVNPGAKVETAAVFNALGLAKGEKSCFGPHPSSIPVSDIQGALRLLANCRNDLEAPAIALNPVIAEGLSLMRTLPNCALARMSGSGATVFGLFRNCHSAASAARIVKTAKPLWWVRCCVL